MFVQLFMSSLWIRQNVATGLRTRLCCLVTYPSIADSGCVKNLGRPFSPCQKQDLNRSLQSQCFTMHQRRKKPNSKAITSRSGLHVSLCWFTLLSSTWLSCNSVDFIAMCLQTTHMFMTCSDSFLLFPVNWRNEYLPLVWITKAHVTGKECLVRDRLAFQPWLAERRLRCASFIGRPQPLGMHIWPNR